MMNKYPQICVFSDMHFMAYKDTNLPVDWICDLEESLIDATTLHPGIVVFNGDLTNGKIRDS